MPITPYLNGCKFTPELTRVAKLAFAMTRVAIRLPDNNHPVVALAAKRVVELAEAGECDADHICEQVLLEIRGWRFQESSEQRSGAFGALPHVLPTYGISNPHEQARLAAQRVKEFG
jgi:hypothetical protein